MDCVPGTQFESSRDHHAVRCQPAVPGLCQIACNLPAFSRVQMGDLRSLSRAEVAIGQILAPGPNKLMVHMLAAFAEHEPEAWTAVGGIERRWLVGATNGSRIDGTRRRSGSRSFFW